MEHLVHYVACWCIHCTVSKVWSYLRARFGRR